MNGSEKPGEVPSKFARHYIALPSDSLARLCIALSLVDVFGKFLPTIMKTCVVSRQRDSLLCTSPFYAKSWQG